MKIAIVGSRGYQNLDRVREYVKSLSKDTIIVSGGALGVDQAAEGMAVAIGLVTQIFPADWVKHGKKAGILRNQDIVNASDCVIAFWDGVSNGTQSTIKMAEAAGKPVTIVPDTQQV